MNTNLMFSSKTDLWSTPQDFFNKLNESLILILTHVVHMKMLNVKNISLLKKMVLNKAGRDIEYFVIHHMVGKLENGLKKHILKVERKILKLLC